MKDRVHVCRYLLRFYRNNQRELLKLTCQKFRRSLRAVVVNADALSVGRVVFMLHT